MFAQFHPGVIIVCVCIYMKSVNKIVTTISFLISLSPFLLFQTLDEGECEAVGEADWQTEPQ